MNFTPNYDEVSIDCATLFEESLPRVWVMGMIHHKFLRILVVVLDRHQVYLASMIPYPKHFPTKWGSGSFPPDFSFCNPES